MTEPVLIRGDCMEWLPRLPDGSVDACVTDPPYHLSIAKRFGADNAAPAKSNGATGVYKRASAGFMGQQWDGGDIAFRPEVWAEVLRVLKPGGHLVAFGGSRTYHRLACAVEDAGFEVRDQIMWLYGSGFPKSHNQKDEWAGWGTALKPAHEPIVLARKPFKTTVAKNLAEHGCGALNIDGCRVPVDPSADASQLRTMQRSVRTGNDGWGMSTVSGDSPPVVREEGRWPANACHDGSDEVMETLGDPARFFYCAKASKKDRDEGLENLPKQKAGVHSETSGQHITRRDPGYEVAPRANHHPTVKPTALMQWLCRLVTPPGGVILDPFMGSGSTGKAATREGFGFIGIEQDEKYMAIAKARVRT